MDEINKVMMFENAELATQVRSIEIDGRYWFVLSDVSKILGYQRASDAKDHLRDSQYNTANRRISSDLGFHVGRLPTLITESGLYRLMLRSNASNAEPFQIWVEDEVLPTLRRDGVKVDENSSKSDDQIRAEVERQLEKRQYKEVIRDTIGSFHASERDMFWTIRNDFLVKVSGLTAAQLRNSGREIRTWHYGKNGPIKKDLEVGTNYLTENELKEFNLLLDYVALEVRRSNPKTFAELESACRKAVTRKEL